MKSKKYKLIPMSEITDEARELAVLWGSNMKDNFITQKHKLASDIMNYANEHAREMAVEFMNDSITGVSKEMIESWYDTFLANREAGK
jgi:hypothetical protein